MTGRRADEGKATMSAGRWYLLAFMTGAAARLLFLGQKSIWHDEAISLLTAARPHLRDSLECAMDFDFGAPAYPLLLRLWLFLGSGDATVRLLSVVGSLVGLWAAINLARAWLKPPAAMAAAWLAALLPFSIEYAQEVRVYAWLGGLELLMALALARMLAGDRGRWRGAWAAALAVGAASHAAVWIWWVAQMAGLCVTRRGRSLIKGLLAWTIPAAALAAVLAAGALDSWLGRLSHPYLLPSVGEFMRQAAILFTAGHHAGPEAGLAAVAIVPLLTAAGVWAVASDRPRRTAGWLLAFQAILPPVAVYAGIAVGASAMLRYVPAAPVALALLLAAGAAALPRAAHAAAVFLLMLVSAAGYGGWYTRPPTLEPTFCLLSKKPLRDVADFVAANARPGDTVVHVTTASWLPMRWYAPSLRQGYLIANPDEERNGPVSLFEAAEPLERQLEGASRMWLISCPWRFSDEPAIPGELAPVLSARCGPPRVFLFNGIDVYVSDIVPPQEEGIRGMPVVARASSVSGGTTTASAR